MSLGCLLVRILLKKSVSVKILKYLGPFLLIVILIIYSYLLPMVKGTGDYQIARLLLIFVLIYLPTSYLLVLLVKRYNSFFTLRSLFQSVVIINLIQSVILLLMFLNPDLKAWVYTLLRDDRSEFNLLSGGIRMLGFAYSTVWDLAFLQSLSLFLIVYLIQGRSGFKIFAYTFSYLLILVSIIFSGRTGFIGAIFSLLLLVLIPLLKYGSLNKASVLLPGYLAGIIIFVIGILNSLLPSDVKDIISDKVVPWAFEIFINKAETGNIQSASSDDLKTMYFPVSAQTFLLGDGQYRDPVDPNFYYKDTDAGYMRHVLFYGIIGSLILYTFYLTLFLVLIYTAYKSGIHSLSIVYFAMLIYFFIGHIKGDLFVGAAMPIRMLFLIYVFHSCMKGKEEYGLI